MYFFLRFESIWGWTLSWWWGRRPSSFLGCRHRHRRWTPWWTPRNNRSSRFFPDKDCYSFISMLIQHFSFKVNEAMFSRPKKESNYFVRDCYVDLKDLTKGDDPSITHLDSIRPDDVTQLINLFVYMKVGFDSSRFCERSLLRSSVSGGGRHDHHWDSGDDDDGQQDSPFIISWNRIPNLDKRITIVFVDESIARFLGLLNKGSCLWPHRGFHSRDARDSREYNYVFDRDRQTSRSRHKNTHSTSSLLFWVILIILSFPFPPTSSFFLLLKETHIPFLSFKEWWWDSLSLSAVVFIVGWDPRPESG